jgi:hypothetical protein
MIGFDLLSKRKYENWPSWHIIYEWEEDFCKSLNISLCDSLWLDRISDNRFIKAILARTPGKQIFQQIDRMFPSNKKHIVFELFLKNNFSYSNAFNSIPVIIDFYSRDVGFFNQTYKNSRLICITSLQVYNFLKQHDCTLNIKHLPLSLSDRYVGLPSESGRKYDLLIAGRKNKVLWDFLLAFEKKFPEIEYVYQEQMDGKLFYKSNKNGLIGSFYTRSEYIELLQQCKIAFYSTPGIDGEEKRTRGFSQVTPRYLELIASGCLLMGRYPANEETAFYELSEYCPNIESYDQFENVLNNYLSSDYSIDAVSYRKLLDKHHTSKRADLLKAYIQETFG